MAPKLYTVVKKDHVSILISKKGLGKWKKCGHIRSFSILAENIRIECNRGFTVFCDSKPKKYSNQKVSFNTKWFNDSRIEIQSSRTGCNDSKCRRSNSGRCLTVKGNWIKKGGVHKGSFIFNKAHFLDELYAQENSHLKMSQSLSQILLYHSTVWFTQYEENCLEKLSEPIKFY